MENHKYIIGREKLIPQAERHADKTVRSKPKKTGKIMADQQAFAEWYEEWNKCFHGEMCRLAVEAGLVRG